MSDSFRRPLTLEDLRAGVLAAPEGIRRYMAEELAEAQRVRGYDVVPLADLAEKLCVGVFHHLEGVGPGSKADPPVRREGERLIAWVRSLRGAQGTLEAAWARLPDAARRHRGHEHLTFVVGDALIAEDGVLWAQRTGRDAVIRLR